LRDKKFYRLAEKIDTGNRAGIIGVSVGTKSYFGLEITTELVQELESPPKRNRRIRRVETHWPFGGKPVVSLNLRLLKVAFHPFKDLPTGLPFVVEAPSHSGSIPHAAGQPSAASEQESQ
jgi:hypothetical protein